MSRIGAGQDALSVTYTAGQFGQNYNFGELLAASVFGAVYIDLNDNGAQNGGELGIAGVTVTLQGADDLGIPVWQTRTTNSAGGFAFSGLRPGVYTLAEFQPAGYSDGKDSFPNGANNPISDLFGGLAPASGQDQRQGEPGCFHREFRRSERTVDRSSGLITPMC